MIGGSIDKMQFFDTNRLIFINTYFVTRFVVSAITAAAFSSCCYLSRIITRVVPISSMLPEEQLLIRGINNVSHLFVSLACLSNVWVHNQKARPFCYKIPKKKTKVCSSSKI